MTSFPLGGGAAPFADEGEGEEALVEEKGDGKEEGVQEGEAADFLEEEPKGGGD